MQQQRRPLATTSCISDVIPSASYPPSWPFTDKDFERMDESPDSIFYGQPRFVTHIDDDAINALTEFYAKMFDEGFHARGGSRPNILDVCSSWISHFPTKVGPPNSEKNGYGKIIGTGMVAQELARNKVLNSYLVRDLNQNPSLSPLEDNTFDFVTCTVSIDYLTRPLQVLSEILRVLKPGGMVIISFSNRMFPTKATRVWLSATDADRVWIVGAFLHYARNSSSAGTAMFQHLRGWDISPNDGTSDPMYVVTGVKATVANEEQRL